MKKLNKEMKFIVVLAIIAIIGVAISDYMNHLVEKTRMETIENAVLVESNDQGYVLNFYGEEYSYSFN